MPIPPEAAELANEANSVFVDEDYDTALELYSEVRCVRYLRPVLGFCCSPASCHPVLPFFSLVVKQGDCRALLRHSSVFACTVPLRPRCFHSRGWLFKQTRLCFSSRLLRDWCSVMLSWP